ncbi:MAG: T9SS type A sorting domain-containing protein, partial [Bacteroidales bacterium]|nr:T9SS type A sorting domain-containing protein [Bacteroidales bacterium]
VAGWEGDTITNVKNQYVKELSENLIIYPNPVKEKIIIEMLNGENINKSELISITGEVVFRKEYSNAFQGQDELEIDVVKPGLYFLKVTTVSSSIIKEIVFR